MRDSSTSVNGLAVPSSESGTLRAAEADRIYQAEKQKNQGAGLGNIDGMDSHLGSGVSSPITGNGPNVADRVQAMLPKKLRIILTSIGLVIGASIGASIAMSNGAPSSESAAYILGGAVVGGYLLGCSIGIMAGLAHLAFLVVLYVGGILAVFAGMAFLLGL